MDRRTFLSWVGIGTLASTLPVAIAACTSEKTETTAAKPSDPVAKDRPDGFSVVGTVKDLDQTGFIQDKGFAGGPLLIVYDPTNKAKLVAVNSTCTHKGCIVDWKADNKEFACACHGSKFKLDGSVAAGPASKPLTTFIARTEGDSVLAKAV
jgi:cytochrome b6-f complex iron-sulfur subunit